VGVEGRARAMTRQDWQVVKSELRVPRRWPTVGVIVLDAAIFAVSAWLTQQGVSARLPAILLLTFALHHAYLLSHEAQHSAISKHTWLNNLVGHICSWSIAVPFLSRQRSHMLHHSFTGHPDKDPANKRVIQRFAVMNEAQAQTLERIWSSWVPLLTLNDRVGLWRDAFRQRREKPTVRRFEREVRANYCYLVAYAAALGGLSWLGQLELAVAWYLPAWAFQLALDELVNLPHHAETPLLDHDADALPLWEQHVVTHSCKTVPVWSSCALLHFNLHIAHHLFPWIPWHELPDAQHKLQQRVPALSHERTTRNELHWSLQNRQRPLLTIMQPYFDRIPRDQGTH
jgi:acyl-lipid omega-6 desaturase (Delta-12 desaturase)